MATTSGIISSAASTTDPNSPQTTPATTAVAPTDPLPSNATPSQAPNVTGDIHDAYNQYLGRSGRNDEAAFWQNQVNSGAMTMDQVRQQIANSPEATAWRESQNRPGVPQAAQSTAVNATSVGYTPAQLSVTPEMTVAGQLAKINDPNSPIIQQARTQALQDANSRGLLNSSMAVTAGEDAAYRASLPIAQQDANTNLGVGTLNTNSTNTALGFTADAANRASLTNASLGTQASEFNAGEQNKLTGDLIQQKTSLGTAQIGANASTANARLSADASQNIARIQSQTQQTIASIDTANRVQLQQMQNTNSQLLQTDQGAQTMWQNAIASINNIQNNNGMDATTKAAAINNIATTLQNSLSAIGKINSLNLDNLVTFGSSTTQASTTNPTGTYTAPDGSIWVSQQAYEAAHPYSAGGGGG